MSSRRADRESFSIESGQLLESKALGWRHSSEFPWASPLVTPSSKGLYLTIYPSSCPNTDTLSKQACRKLRLWKTFVCFWYKKHFCCISFLLFRVYYTYNFRHVAHVGKNLVCAMTLKIFFWILEKQENSKKILKSIWTSETRFNLEFFIPNLIPDQPQYNHTWHVSFSKPKLYSFVLICLNNKQNPNFKMQAIWKIIK